MTCEFPASVMLVASLNPCPCGHRGDERKQCHCDDFAVKRYMSRLSGPLLDRIDMHVEVRGVAFDKLQEKEVGMTSAQAREEVMRAREIQNRRFEGLSCTHNASMGAKEVAKYCELDPQSRKRLQAAFDKRGMSARSYDRLLKVARTIADLAGEESIQTPHIAQALQYRQLDELLE